MVLLIVLPLAMILLGQWHYGAIRLPIDMVQFNWISVRSNRRLALFHSLPILFSIVIIYQ